MLSLGGSQACHASGVIGIPISVRMSFTSEETVGERAQLAMLIDCHGTCLPELSLGLRHHDITQPILVSHLFPLERKHNPPRRKPTTSMCQNEKLDHSKFLIHDDFRNVAPVFPTLAVVMTLHNPIFRNVGLRSFLLQRWRTTFCSVYLHVCT